MKKQILLLLAIAMCFSFVACGGSSGGSDYYKLGETVSTDVFEFTLNAAEYTVALNNVRNDSYFAPKEYDLSDDADNPYVAPVGHTYAAFSYTVTNLNRASSEFHDGSFAVVKYDGKKYNAMDDGAYFLYEDKQIMDVDGKLRTEKAGEWYSNPGNNFLLLTGAKETRRAYIDISESIDNLNDDVEITVQIPNSKGKAEKFTYLVTEADRAAYTNPEITMSLELALVSFTEDAGQAYFASRMDEYAVVSGDRIDNIVLSGKWKVDYIIEGMGYWSGNFWFERDGQIKDDYGYVNERTWKVKGDTLIINGKKECEMRQVADDVYLLVCNGSPYMLMQ